MSKSKKETKDELYWDFKEKRISIHQFRAQMRDIGYSEQDIDLYIDGADEDEDA